MPEAFSDKILFHHIAKTAGTSLIELLTNAYGRRNTSDIRYDFEVTEEMVTAPELRFYHGHYSFDYVDYARRVSPVPMFIFTFLRNPIDRVVSQYYNWTDKERVYKEFGVVAERSSRDDIYGNRLELFEKYIFDMSLEDFLRSDLRNVKVVVSNHHLRHLAHDRSFKQDKDQAVAEALDHLANFYDFFGIMELYDQSMLRLMEHLNLDYGAFDRGTRRNTNEARKKDNRYSLSKRAFDLLVEQNYYDLKLYYAAVGLFLARNNIKHPELIGRIGQDPLVEPDVEALAHAHVSSA